MSGPWGRGEDGVFEKLGEVATVAGETRPRGSMTTDTGLQGTQRSLVFTQRTVDTIGGLKEVRAKVSLVLQRWL